MGGRELLKRESGWEDKIIGISAIVLCSVRPKVDDYRKGSKIFRHSIESQSKLVFAQLGRHFLRERSAQPANNLRIHL
jgi:hypothetical protein